MTKDEIAELQTQIYLDGIRRYEEAHGMTRAQMDAKFASQAGSAPTSTYEKDRAKLAKLEADYKRKYPDATKVTFGIGPKEAAMIRLAAAVRRGNAGEARDGYLGVCSLPGGA